MRKKWILLTLAAALLLGAGAIKWLGTQPALLDNMDVSLAESDVFLPDETVPLAQAPAIAAVETSPDLYKDLDDTQIGYVKQVLELVNQARTEAGVPALTLDPALWEAAQVRAVECVGTFSHTRPNGTSYKTAITEAGIETGYSGENVATGHTSAEQVVNSWLKSEGHRANILNPNYTRIGIGLEKNVGNKYRGFTWTQLFTS